VTTVTSTGERRFRLSPAGRTWLLLSPALAVIVVLFLGGVFFGVIQSLNYLPLIGQYDLNLDAYGQMFSDSAFIPSLGLSLWIAFTATVVSAVLAVAISLFLRQTSVGRRLGTYLFQLNLAIPHIVGAVAMLALLSQSGLLSRLTNVVGLTHGTSGFPALTNDRWGISIVAEYVWKEVPFIGVVVLAALAAGTRDYEDLARTLGAGRWQRFRYVILPHIIPGVLSTSIIVFAFAFGAYEVPFLLGQPYPATLSVLAYLNYTDVDLAARSEAQAINVVIATIVTLLAVAYLGLSSRLVRAER
jgi:putative spermidine/putrescine transport system permease protein